MSKKVSIDQGFIKLGHGLVAGYIMSELASQIATGERGGLKIDEVAKTLRVSAFEVEEACLALEKSGHLTIEGNQNWQDVSQFSPSEFVIHTVCVQGRIAMAPTGSAKAEQRRVDRSKCGCEWDEWEGERYSATVSEAGDKFSLEITATEIETAEGEQPERRTALNDATFETPEEAWNAWDKFVLDNKPNDRFYGLDGKRFRASVYRGAESFHVEVQQVDEDGGIVETLFAEDTPTDAEGWTAVEAWWRTYLQQRYISWAKDLAGDVVKLTPGSWLALLRTFNQEPDQHPEGFELDGVLYISDEAGHVFPFLNVLEAAYEVTEEPEADAEGAPEAKTFDLALADGVAVKVEYFSDWTPVLDRAIFRGPINELGELTKDLKREEVQADGRPLEDFLFDMATKLRKRFVKGQKPEASNE